MRRTLRRGLFVMTSCLGGDPHFSVRGWHTSYYGDNMNWKTWYELDDDERGIIFEKYIFPVGGFEYKFSKLRLLDRRKLSSPGLKCNWTVINLSVLIYLAVLVSALIPWGG